MRTVKVVAGGPKKNLSTSRAGTKSVSSGSVTQWIDLFRAGDEEAATQLWHRYFAPLVGAARAKLGILPASSLDAEDIALSAFHALYRAATSNRLPEMNDRDGLWQSLLLIAAGKAVDAKRRQLAQKRGGAEAAHAPLHLLDSMQSSELDPTIAAIISEEFEGLLARLDEPELKEIAVLKLEGFTNDEIAERLDCSDRTIKRRLMMIRRIWEESGMAPSA